MSTPADPVVLSNVTELDGNPYLELWSGAMRRSGARMRPLTLTSVRAAGGDRPAWVHLQWPERALRHPGSLSAARNGLRLAVLLGIARARGARVMVTAHNVWSHDRRHPWLEHVMWAALGLLATDLHTLSEAGGREFAASHPTFRRARRRVIPHGSYEPVAVDPPGRTQARASLGVPADAHVLATFGLLKAYKGVEDVLDAFMALDRPDARLVVAGRVADESLGRRLEAAGRSDSRLVVLPRFLADAELASVIRAADRVVLPYRRVLNSGAALLALSFDRPVLLPRSPSFEALRERVGNGWVTLFDLPLTATDLARAPDTPHGRPDLTWCSWDVVERSLAALWREAA